VGESVICSDWRLVANIVCAVSINELKPVISAKLCDEPLTATPMLPPTGAMTSALELVPAKAEECASTIEKMAANDPAAKLNEFFDISPPETVIGPAERNVLGKRNDCPEVRLRRE